MMDFKNHNMQGVSLIEVMASIFMIGILLTTILNLQFSVFSNVMASTARLRRIYLLKSTLFETTQNRLLSKEQKKEQKIEKPPTTIRYTERKPQSKSTLKSFKNIMIELVQAEWGQKGEKEKEQMMYLFFKPEKKK